MQRDERVRTQGQPLAHLQGRRQRIGKVACVRQCPLDKRPQPLRRHLLARRVDRREVGGRGDTVQVVGAHLEAVALELAAQAHVRPGLQLLLEPRLVEPDRDDLTTLVADPGVDDRQIPPRSPHRDRPHLARDGGLLPREQVGDPPLGHGGLVPMRPMLEQVAEAAQSELCELLLQRGPDPGKRRHRPLRVLGSRRPRQPGPALGRILSGKAFGHPASLGTVAATRRRRTRRSRPCPAPHGRRRPGQES